MTPDWNPDMEELNKRRVERHMRRQQMYVKKRRRKTASMVAVCLLLVAIGAGVFYLVRQGENTKPKKNQQADQSATVVSEDATVIHLVAAGDVNVSDAIVASGGPNYEYTETFKDVAHLLAEGD